MYFYIVCAVLLVLSLLIAIGFALDAGGSKSAKVWEAFKAFLVCLMLSFAVSCLLIGVPAIAFTLADGREVISSQETYTLAPNSPVRYVDNTLEFIYVDSGSLHQKEVYPKDIILPIGKQSTVTVTKKDIYIDGFVPWVYQTRTIVEVK